MKPSDADGSLMAHDGRVTDPRPTGRPNARLRQSVGDMVRSLAVVLIVVAVTLVIVWRPKPDAVKPVDPIAAVTLVTMQKEFPPLVPTALPADWTVTSARFEPTAKSQGRSVFHIGYVTPSGQYAQVQESTATSAGFLSESTDRGAASGTRVVGSQTWQVWNSDERRSLVLADDSHVVVVSGTGTLDEVAALAGSLQPPQAQTSAG
jgi:hypothetical protein